MVTDRYAMAIRREQRESMRRAAALRHPAPRLPGGGVSRYTALPEPEPADLARRVERLATILRTGQH